MDLSAEYSELFVDGLCERLKAEGIDDGVISVVQVNKITGADFLELDSDLLKELFPVVGNRLAVARCIKKWTSKVEADPPQCTHQLTSDIGIIGWVESLPFPTHYSKTTTEAIQKGVYTKSARTEIVNAISTRIMDHTMTPTSVEYTKLCARLISVYPNSADTVGNRYGSWKMQFRNKFKNVRRPSKSSITDKENMGPSTETEQNPTKKPRRDDNDDDGDYLQNVRKLRVELDRCKPRYKVVKTLMAETFSGRRKWIVTDNPTVQEVLGVFPCLTRERHLRNDMKAVLAVEDVSSLLSTWNSWVEAVFKYAELESKRPSIGKILDEYKASADDSEDFKGLYGIRLLTALLAPKAKIRLFEECKDTSVMDQEIEQYVSPFILVVTSDESRQFFVAVEKKQYMEVDTFVKALAVLYSIFFVYDMSYPKPLYVPIIYFFTAFYF